MQLTITPTYIAILSLFYIFLALRVIKLRWKERVSIGDGGKENLKRAIRTHANFNEYMPLTCILLVCLEVQNFHNITLHVLCSLMVISRTMHFFGIRDSKPTTKNRFFGMIITFGLIITCSLIILYNFLANMMN